MVGLGRLELPTYGLGNRRSIHLSYSPVWILNFRLPQATARLATRYRRCRRGSSEDSTVHTRRPRNTFHLCYVCYHRERRRKYSRVPPPGGLMSRTLRYVLIGLGVLILLLIVLPFLVPVNQFKPTIEEKA